LSYTLGHVLSVGKSNKSYISITTNTSKFQTF